MRKHGDQEKGQVSIMIGMMMLTFILFFAFVTNTGVLVNAKINLQNAADLAAYAGAATQARQLTNISYLNYEMRRQYKKFLFRYYVIGNMAQDTQPKTPGTGPRIWSPGAAAPQLFNYGTPTVCLVFNPVDNYCQLGILPAIKFGISAPPTDAINQALFAQLQDLETIRQNNCDAIALTNLQVLMTWLYNADPTLANLRANLTDPNQQKVVDVVKGVANGLGLIPREVILHQRIKTLESYVNFPHQSGVTTTQVNALESANDQQAGERTIQAFLSAYNTLGDHIYEDDSQIVMDELQPDELLNLKDVKISFDAYATVMETANDQPASGNGSPCVAKLAPITVPNMPVGVTKDPTVLTYYAIRLSANAKLLFSPFGNITMKAYAAARPFGSRIGPDTITASEFTRPFATPGKGPNPGSLVSTIQGGNGQLLSNFAGFVPNLPVVASDSAAQGAGWDTNFMTGAMYAVLAGTSGNVISETQAEHAYAVAMAPSIPEGSKYNIPSDSPQDLFVKLFDQAHQYVFWAPVVSPDAGDAIATITQAVAALYAPDPNAGQSSLSNKNSLATLGPALANTVIKYVALMQQGQGENGEGVNIAKIIDPMTDPSTNTPINIPQISMTSPKQYRTSYANVNDSAIQAAGRVGYSVKMVSFDSLTAHPPKGDDSGATPTNVLSLDDVSAGDVTALKH